MSLNDKKFKENSEDYVFWEKDVKKAIKKLRKKGREGIGEMYKSTNLLILTSEELENIFGSELI